IARLLVEKRHLAENIARTERCNPALRDSEFLSRHASAAARDEKELLADVSLADDDIAPRVFTLVHAVGDVCDLGRCQILEQLDGAQKSADRERLAQNHIRYDMAVNHIHDAVGKLEDA